MMASATFANVLINKYIVLC